MHWPFITPARPCTVDQMYKASRSTVSRYRGALSVHAPEHAAQNIERVGGIAHQAHVFGSFRPGGAEHQPVLQRMLLSVAEVLHSERLQVLLRIIGARPSIQVRRKTLEATTHHLGQQVVAAGVMLVRRLVGHTELARHVAQAQVFDAAFGNHFLRRHDAGVAKFQAWRGFGLLSGHAMSRSEQGSARS